MKTHFHWRRDYFIHDMTSQLPFSHGVSSIPAIRTPLSHLSPQLQCIPCIVHVPTPSTYICIKDVRLLRGSASERVSRSLVKMKSTSSEGFGILQKP
ncbi:hypothetical protein CDAR_609531 [Caerostris darwini]|uniref:Uncharacterized protein n=1 Tax=Caerostris darwini TaxID=1538125 RepID=A0AAV4SE56_9ARAC|nr:hypothetical protein CDAR_609531 [Caerostris darwini]